MAKSNYDARMVFENAALLAQSQGYDLSQAVCTQSFIRSEVAMSTSAASYQLPILVNAQSSARVLENRLQLQDLFYVSELFLGWTDAASGTTTGQLYTYPNSVAAGSSGIATALRAFYNGKLSIQMNNRNVVPAWDVNRHYFVGQTQQNANQSATPTSPAVFAVDELNLSENGFVPVEPGWILNGAANINATVQLPGAITSIPTNGAIVAIFRGILIQNATTVK